jgi:hypothetical protein
MKESLRKPILFMVIVVVGSVLVLFDIPLLLLLPLLLLVGFGTLLALGSITIPEIRGGIAGFGKTGVLKRLNDIKIFEKTPAGAKQVPPTVVGKKDGAKEKKKEKDDKPGLAAHISTFFSSIGSLGSVLRQKSQQGKKVEDIDKLLDKTVSEKVSAPPPGGMASVVPSGGAGASPGKGLDMDDPFMSLSGDEFDEGLLDGLGDDVGSGISAPAQGEEPVFNPADFPDLETDGLPEPTHAVSPTGGDTKADAGKSAGGGGLEEFSGLDGGDLPDADFGDLDGLSLDDIEPDADPGSTPDAASAAPATSPDTTAQPAPANAPAADSNAVKTAWIPSDAPKDANEMEDDVSTQADMAAFAGGSGGDEDLLSSIASDVKHTKKEQDLSLLRELKDFRAPAVEIEKELGGMYERMNLAQQTKKKDPSAPKGIK